jgi:F420-0:gamma-glutamyl ligase-like protein
MIFIAGKLNFSDLLPLPGILISIGVFVYWIARWLSSLQTPVPLRSVTVVTEMRSSEERNICYYLKKIHDSKT